MNWKQIFPNFQVCSHFSQRPLTPFCTAAHAGCVVPSHRRGGWPWGHWPRLLGPGQAPSVLFSLPAPLRGLRAQSAWQSEPQSLTATPLRGSGGRDGPPASRLMQGLRNISPARQGHAPAARSTAGSAPAHTDSLTGACSSAISLFLSQAPRGSPSSPSDSVSDFYLKPIRLCPHP